VFCLSVFSENGWMTREIFHSWFVSFIRNVSQRPLILVFDGHSAHLGLNTIHLAKENNISLIKLPSHTTDKLQPLDVSVFSPLKLLWDAEILAEQRNNGFSAISKGKFVDLLCKIWPRGMKESTIKSGFRSTGIFPVDRSKYPVNAFDSIKLVSFMASATNSELLQDGFPAAPPMVTTAKESIPARTKVAASSSQSSPFIPSSIEREQMKSSIKEVYIL
jgi:hypothetical protein